MVREVNDWAAPLRVGHVALGLFLLRLAVTPRQVPMGARPRRPGQAGRDRVRASSWGFSAGPLPWLRMPRRETYRISGMGLMLSFSQGIRTNISSKACSGLPDIRPEDATWFSSLPGIRGEFEESQGAS